MTAMISHKQATCIMQTQPVICKTVRPALLQYMPDALQWILPLVKSTFKTVVGGTSQLTGIVFVNITVP